MVKPVVTEVRKINSDLSQKFHSVFVAVAAEAGFGRIWSLILSLNFWTDVEYLISLSKVSQ